MTVHGAKGLEFPVVILAGLGVAPPARHAPVLWGGAGPEARIPLPRGETLQTAGYAALDEHDQQATRAERIRLLYVGATHARDQLAVSLHHRAGDGCDAATLAAVLGIDALEEVGQHDRLLPGVRAAPSNPVASSSAADDDLTSDYLAARTAWAAARTALVAQSSRAPVVAASQLSHLEHDQPAPVHRATGGSRRSGTAIGRAVHRTLQTVDLVALEDLGRLARAHAEAERIPEHAVAIEDLARAVAESSTLRRVVASGRWWREVPVSADVDGVVLEGFVDLLWDGPDGLVVVDYKTDHVEGPEAIDAAVTRHRLQGAAYALALEQTLRRPVVEVLLLFARAPGVVAVAIPDLPAAVAAARAALAAFYAAGVTSAAPADTRTAILAVARRRFAEHGFAGTSAGEIADEVGIRRPSLFHHFPSKLALYRAVLLDAFEDWWVLLDEAVTKPVEGWLQVERVLRAAFTFFQERPDFVRLARWEALEGGSILAAEIGATLRPHFEAGVGFLERQMELGNLRRCDARRLVLTGYGAVLSYLSDAPLVAALLGEDPLTQAAVEAEQEHILDLFRHALAP